MAEQLSTGMVNALNTVGSVKAVMTNFIIRGFSGTQPVNGDAAEGAGLLLFEVTESGGAFVSGFPENGLNFGLSVDGVLAKAAAESWEAAGLTAAGTGTIATWFRAYANTVATGASNTAIRFDGAIGTSTAYELQLGNITIQDGAPILINAFNYTTRKS